MEGGDRIDDTPVHKALREALANCLINTDFYGTCGVVIRKEPDRLFLENPGYIRTGKKQMRLGGRSDPRNKALMKMFNLINIGERAGSGVPNIFQVWEAQGWTEPVILEQFNPDRTILELCFTKKVRKKSAKKKCGKKMRETRLRKRSVSSMNGFSLPCSQMYGIKRRILQVWYLSGRDGSRCFFPNLQNLERLKAAV